jgi:hypothetical protein
MTSDIVYERLTSRKHIALIVGDVRCGKTYLACKYITHNMPPSHPTRFDGEWYPSECPRFVMPIELMTMNLETIGELKNPCGLVIDDLDRVSEHVQSFIFPLCQYRAMAGTPTLITTRLSVKTFSMRYGDRLMELIEKYGVIINAKEHYSEFPESAYVGDVGGGDACSAGQHEGVHCKREASDNSRKPEVESLAKRIVGGVFEESPVGAR